MSVFYYIGVILIWGTTWFGIKIGLEDLNPIYSLGIRFLFAGIILLLFILIKYKGIPEESKDIKLILLLTFFSYTVPYALVYWGEQFIFSDLTSVIFARGSN